MTLGNQLCFVYVQYIDDFSNTFLLKDSNLKKNMYTHHHYMKKKYINDF